MPQTIDKPEVGIHVSVEQLLTPNWHVIFLNDDYHTFGFVVFVITTIFKKSVEDAFAFTQKIHLEGQAVITTCSKERAELYAEQVSSVKEGEKGSIGCVIEPAE